MRAPEDVELPRLVRYMRAFVERYGEQPEHLCEYVTDPEESSAA